MINSMTGFAHQQIQHALGTFTCELRAVNQRYLELFIRLPDTLRELETPLRELTRQSLQRGKVECQVRYQPNSQANISCEINLPLVKNILQAAQQIDTEVGRSSHLNALQLLQWPGVLAQTEVDAQALQAVVLPLFQRTLETFCAMRAREGAALQQLIIQRLDRIEVEVKKVHAHTDELVTKQRTRLQQRVAELLVNVDAARLEQEIVLLAQKADVAEELDRLTTHIAEVRRSLQQGGAIGRRLDFLMQELHREANTLAAKSTETSVTQSSIEIRVLIEQMREQVQNIE